MGWTGPELVCRGVQLILDGALDRGTEAGLGAQLGVSARHLRRLFAANLGVTPDGLARSARVHFARRLLDDTDLTIIEVAFAAGFGSLRQFNRACQDVFRASPRALRDRRRVTDRLAADGGLTLRLPFDGPLDWDAILTQLAAAAIPGVEDFSASTYRRTVVVGGDPGVLELLPGGDDHLVLRAHLPHWEELIHLVQRARRIANLDFDLHEPTGQLARDPVVGPLIRARPGLRPPGTWDPFETGVRAIIEQQATVGTAHAAMERLVERLGSPVGGLHGLGLARTFPSAAALGTADLKGLGLPETRADAVRSFAQAVTEGTIRLDRSVSLDRLISSMTAIPGVETSTAHYIAFRLGEPDACPTTDLGCLPDRWRPWRALAAAHVAIDRA